MGRAEGKPRAAKAVPAAKAAQGPKAAAEPADVDPVEEASLEDQIQELETTAKAFRGIDTPKAKSQLDQWDGELKALRERQKKARPLPARLQAATARLTKAKATQVEVNCQVAELQEQLGKAFKEQEEAAAGVTEADAELQAMMELAAIASMVSMACQTGGLAANLVGAHGFNLDPAVIETMKLQILQHFNAAGAAAPTRSRRASPGHHGVTGRSGDDGGRSAPGSSSGNRSRSTPSSCGGSCGEGGRNSNNGNGGCTASGDRRGGGGAGN